MHDQKEGTVSLTEEYFFLTITNNANFLFKNDNQGN